jgi:hypothetical protein
VSRLSTNQYWLLALLIVTALCGFGRGADTDTRLPVPDEAARKLATPKVEEVIRAGSVRPKSKRRGAAAAALGLLVDKLLAKAAVTTGDDATRYCLLDAARDLAARGGDVDGAAEAVRELADTWRVDAANLGLQTVAELAPAATGPADAPKLVGWASTLMLDAIDDTSYAAARRAGEIALAAARGIHSTANVNALQIQLKRIDALEAAYEPVRTAVDKLKKEPTDPQANLTVGRFYAFEKGDWQQGLPALSHGADPALRSLAVTDLKTSTETSDPQPQVDAGDAWWDWSANQQSESRTRGLQRAAFWYARATAHLTGLARVRAQKRIDEASVGPESPDTFPPLGLVLYYRLSKSNVMPVASKGPPGGRPAQSALRDLCSDSDQGIVRSVEFADVAASTTFGIFDGHASEIECASPTLQLSTAFTIDALIRVHGAGSGSIVSRDDWDGGPTRGYVMRLWSGHPDITIGVNGWRSAGSKQELESGRWTHVTATFDGRTLQMLIGGEVVGSTPVKGRMAVSRWPLLVGNDTFARDRRLAADVAQVMIFSRALRPSEIHQIVGQKLLHPGAESADQSKGRR